MNFTNLAESVLKLHINVFWRTIEKTGGWRPWSGSVFVHSVV